jgi:beta-glucosidase
VVGDQAGLFGRGTVGEGNDAESLELPGVQRQIVEAIVATGKPVIMVLLTGRPYVLGWALEGAPESRPAAVIQAFFPGEEGGNAIADLILGKANPSGRLPVSLPRTSGSQPYSYLHPILGGNSDVTNTDSAPCRPFGFGLSYASYRYSDLTVQEDVKAGDAFTASVTVTNTSDTDGVDVVQLYGHDVKGSITRPVVQLLGYQRVAVPAGQSRTVTFAVPTTRFAFSDRRMVKIVEPGDVEVWVGSHAFAKADEAEGDKARQSSITSRKKGVTFTYPGTATPRATMAITGEVHEVTNDDERWVTATVA